MKPAINGIPEEKIIIYPIWRDERKHLFSVGDIAGAVAMWAVRQSPYEAPENLTEAIKSLTQVLNEQIKFDDVFHFAELTYDEIHSILQEHLEKVSVIMQWNEPRSGHDAPFVTSSRYHTPRPDDDFIDLDALARNVALTLTQEKLVEEDQK